VNKKRKVWFEFWGRGEIGFFWGKKRKIWWIEKYLEIWKIWKREFITFQHNLVGILVNWCSTSEGKKKEKKKKERGCHQSYECVYTHTHQKFEERRKRKRLGVLLLLLLVKWNLVGWLFVTKVKGAKVGYSMNDESLLNWPRQILPASGATIV
jgi:hypothetical protein